MTIAFNNETAYDVGDTALFGDIEKRWDGKGWGNVDADVVAKHSEVVTKHGDVVTKHGDVVTKHGDIVTKHGDVSTKHGDVSTKHGEVTTKHSDVVTKHGDVVTKLDDVTTKHDVVVAKHDAVMQEKTDMTALRDQAQAFRNEAGAISGQVYQDIPTTPGINYFSPDALLAIKNAVHPTLTLDVDFVLRDWLDTTYAPGFFLTFASYALSDLDNNGLYDYTDWWTAYYIHNTTTYNAYYEKPERVEWMLVNILIPMSTDSRFEHYFVDLELAGIIPVSNEEGKLNKDWMNLDEEFVAVADAQIKEMHRGLVSKWDAGSTTITNAIEAIKGFKKRFTSESRLKQVEKVLSKNNITFSSSLDDASISVIDALKDSLETFGLAQASQFEYNAEIHRMNGQSGLMKSRGYEYSGTKNYHQPQDVGYAALNMHSHANYYPMLGTAEVTAMINGYYIRTRHNDYRLRSPAPVGSNFLETEDIAAPAVPPSVLSKSSVADQITEMREYFKAYATNNTALRDYKSHFRYNLSYMEVWFEKTVEEDLQDPFLSQRHSIDAKNMRELLEKELYLNQGGHKNRFENIPYFGQMIRFVDDKGVAHIGTFKYRIVAKDVGDLNKWNPDTTLKFHRDHRTLARYGVDDAGLMETRSARFEILHDKDTESENGGDYYFRNEKSQLDEMMEMIPGLDGEGNTLTEKYSAYVFQSDNDTITEHRSTQALNAGYYNRWYSFLDDDASGRRNSKRGFSDPTLWVAKTTQDKVQHLNAQLDTLAFSYAIPFELILRTPLEEWNPYNLMEHDEQRDAFKDSQNADGRFGTQEAPYHGYNLSHYYAHTPTSFFDNASSDTDPADTTTHQIFIASNMGNGEAVSVTSSGIGPFSPTISGIDLPAGDVKGFGESIRLRFPVYPTYWEGSAGYAESQAQCKAIEDRLDAAGI